MRRDPEDLGYCPRVRQSINRANEKDIRISLEYWMDDEVWGIRFDDIRGSWGADNMG